MGLVTETLALAALAGVATLLALSLQRYCRFRRLELAIPGPPSLPLLGNTLDFVSVTPDTVLKTIKRMIGGRRELSRFSFINHLMVFVSNAEDLESVVRRTEFGSKSHFLYHLLDDRRSLLQLNGTEWRARRRALEPGFSKSVLNHYSKTFYDEAKGFVERVPTGTPVDLPQALRVATSRNFLRTSISTDMQEQAMPFVDFFEEFVRTANQRSFNPLLWSERLFRMTPSGKKSFQMKEALHDLIRRGIAVKQEELKGETKEGEHPAGERRTLADILVDMHLRAEIPEDDIIDEVKTFFGANVETTVATLSWALIVLSIYPKLQERLFSEVDAVLANREVTFQDLPELKYLECVVKEVLRMFPPILFVGRQCYRETKLGGFVIPANSTIVLNIHGVHFDSQHWRDPSAFDPDRFLPENSQGRHHCAYIPFSIGSRNCIGAKYGMMVVTTFLAAIIRAFRILPAHDHKDVQGLLDNMSFDLTSRLVGGFKVVFQPRGSVGA